MRVGNDRRGRGFAPNPRAANELMRGTVTIGWVSGISGISRDRTSRAGGLTWGLWALLRCPLNVTRTARSFSIRSRITD